MNNIQQGLKEIDQKNEFLFQHDEDQIIRTRRSPLDIVGYVASELFGVLDQRFAKQYETDINKVKGNENHLLELIKNQTTILETTHNVIKTNERQVTSQILAIKEHLEELMDNTTSQLEEQRYFQTLSYFTIHVIMIMDNYRRTQDQLLDALTDTHQGKNNTEPNSA